MKKYLISGALALIACSWLVSCHDDADFGGSIVKAKTEAFDNNFVSVYGKIMPGHTWGFGETSPARTRSANTNNNLWYTYPGITIPGVITDEERKAVADLFSVVHRDQTKTITLTNFWVQQVYKGNSSYSSYLKQDGTRVEGIVGSDHMEELGCGPDNDYINTANHGTLAATNVYTADNTYHTDSLMLMLESSTSKFWYKNSLPSSSELYDNHYYIIEYNGAYYVGFDFESKPSDQSQQGQGYLYGDQFVDRDYIFNDWIVKIIPAYSEDNPTTTVPIVKTVTSQPSSSTYYEVWTGTKVTDIGRVMAEDLGSAQKLDMDFNDVVFEARIVAFFQEIRIPDGNSYTTTNYVNLNGTDYWAYTSDGYANIKLLAAGGTIPIQVAGISVHDAFGNVATSTMINTRNEKMTNGTYIDLAPVDLKKADQSTDFYDYTSIDEIPIAAQYMNEVITVNNSGSSVNVPHKIRVPVTARWPRERIEMNRAYNNAFSSYVSNESYPFWNYAIEDSTNYLEGFGTPIGTVLSESKSASGTVYGSSLDVVSNSAADNTTIPTVASDWTTIWTRSDDNGYLYYANGTNYGVNISNSNFSDMTVGSKIRVYGVHKGTCSVTAGNLGTSSTYHSDGYIEFTVTSSDQISSLQSNGLSITGSNFTVTNVAVQIAEEQPEQPETPDHVVATPGTNETNILSEAVDFESWWSNKYDKVLMPGLGDGSIIRIYGWPTNPTDYQVNLQDGYNSNSLTNHGATATSGISYESSGYMEYTLTSSTIDQINISGGIYITGYNFYITYLTYDNSNVAPEFPSVSNGDLVYNTQTNISEGISINSVDMSNAESVTVTVQGTGDSSSSVSVNGVSATAQSRKRTRSGSPMTYVATLTGDNIGTSIRITGSNFTVYKVYAQVTNASSGEGIVLIDSNHPVTISSDYKILEGSAGSEAQKTAQSIYKQLTAGKSQIRITLVPTKDNWNYFKMHSNNYYFQTEIKGDNSGAYSQYGKDQPFTITITINQEGLNSIDSAVNNLWWYSNMFLLQGADIKCTEFTIIP